MLPTYAVLRVAVRTDHGISTDEAAETITRYLYGRSFYLGSEPHPVLRATDDLCFLIEEHYADAVIPRLASGLYYGRIVSTVDTSDHETA